LRFHIFTGNVPMEPYRPHTTVWLFAIGWAAARAERSGQRLLLTVAAVCSVMLPGFLDDEPDRKLVIVSGILLLIWLTRVPILVALQRLIALLASASLWIDLTQPLTLYSIEWGQSLFNDTTAADSLGATTGADDAGQLHDLRLIVATVIAVTVGVLAWKAYRRVLRDLGRLRTRRVCLTIGPATIPRPKAPPRRRVPAP
jgi:hypothetical protein